MKQQYLPENREIKKERAWSGKGKGLRPLMALLFAALLMLALIPGVLAEGKADLNALISKAPEMYSYWSQKLEAPWVLKTGSSYTLRLAFEETAESPFARDTQPMVYRLPASFAPVSDGQEHAFSVWVGSVLARALYRVDAQENTVEVRWDETSAYYERLIAASGRQFTLDVPVTYLGSGEPIDFGQGYSMAVTLGTYQQVSFGDGVPVAKGFVDEGEYNGTDVTSYYPREVRVTVLGEVQKGSTVQDTLDVPGARIVPESFYAERILRDTDGSSQETREILTLEACGITVESLTDTEFVLSLPAMADQDEIVIHYYAVPAEETDDWAAETAPEYGAYPFLVKAAWGESSTLLSESLHNAVVYARFDAEEGQTNPVFTIRKIDRDGQPLAGAAYRLEEKLPDGSFRLVSQREASVDGVTFVYENLTPGDYVLTETAAPEGYVLAAPQEFTVTSEYSVFWWGTPEAFRYAMYTLIGVKPVGEIIWITHKDVSMLEEPGIVLPPTLNVKTDDWNDSDPAQDKVVWEASSDYDIGDEVPFRLEAVLASNVSAYRKYHITFTDTMEAGLTYLKNCTVTIVRNGLETEVDPSLWQVISQDDHGFRLKVEWGDGTALLPYDLNGARVRVYFSAALNENLTVGERGNVNAARLEYSNGRHYAAEDDGEPVPEETAHTGDYKAIVYSYALRFSKTDDEGNALPGASFKLEKIVAPRTEDEEESLVALPLDEGASTDTDFVFTGLDDGDYLLTETAAPFGFIAAKPIRFTVSAEHAAAWDGKDETRGETLLDLWAGAEYGDFTLDARRAEGLLKGSDIVNTAAAVLELKTRDVNDSFAAEDDAPWVDSADYDIGDSVPFRIRIKLPAALSTYTAYALTVEDHLPEGLTCNKDYIVTLAGEETTDYTVTETENGFSIAFAWASETEGEPLPESLSKAEIIIDYTAALNSLAVLGGQGNINAAAIRCTGGEDADEVLTEDTAVIYTYALTVKKQDEAGNPLTGASFTLEKKLADGTAAQAALDEARSTGDTFFFPGLDDGVYVLTENAVMEGYLPARPVEIVITAEHTLEAEAGDAPMLLSLGTETETGALDTEADLESGTITAFFTNVLEREIKAEVADINDSEETEYTWQGTADHDIGDSVPFRVTTRLPGNISAYNEYDLIFTHTLAPGLTANADFAVTVDGEAFTGFTANKTDTGFEVTLRWTAEEGLLPETLAGKEVALTFSAVLSDKAALGEAGNALTVTLRYPASPLADTQMETAPVSCLVYTYGLTVSKVDEGGAPLTGAAFRLDKTLSDGSSVEIPASAVRSSASTFVFTGLDDGNYLLTETRAPGGYLSAAPIAFTISAEHETVWDGQEETRAQTLKTLSAASSGGTALFTDKQDGMLNGAVVNLPAPSLGHKVSDTNDSAAERDTALWVDSADYDVGDSVPLRVTAELVKNVSSYTRYYASFTNTLEEGLRNNKDYQVFVNGEQITDYTVEDSDRGFTLTITWGNGTSPLPETLNEAEVVIYYTATLTAAAKTGTQGNLSAVTMRFPVNPSSDTEGVTSENRVLVFTYKLAVSSVDDQGVLLSGAAFTLEKKLADGTLRAVSQDTTASTDTQAVFFGLDDGDYILTQTQSPEGYISASSLSFTLRADHTAAWNGDLYTRGYVLTSLSAVKPTGDMTVTAAKASGTVEATVLNVEKPVFEKKVDDLNDSSNNEDAVEWDDTADYDIGDSVRFLLRTKLPANITSFEKFHVTFQDTMEEGLTNNKDYRITVNGKAFTGFTVDKEDEHSFEITLNWAGAAIAEQLANAEVLVQYTAQLNENAWVGGEGNVNTAVMRYSNSAKEDTEGVTDKQRAVVFTYRFTVTKANESGKPLSGAAFKLEKVLANGTKKQIPLDENTSTETAFSFRGLDEGRYILTETKAPTGYVLSTPVEFTITAQHDAIWNNNLYTRSLLLTELTAETDSTDVAIRVDSETMNLRTTIINTRSTEPLPDDDKTGYRNRFYFTKEWLGDVEESINFTLYNPNGSVRRKSFNKTKLSETEYLYEAWFSDWSEFYVLEEPVEGYKVRYENVGDHAGETDRCYNGGRIINYKVPKTGDNFNLGLWIGISAAGLGGLCLLYALGRKRRKAEK